MPTVEEGWSLASCQDEGEISAGVTSGGDTSIRETTETKMTIDWGGLGGIEATAIVVGSIEEA